MTSSMLMGREAGRWLGLGSLDRVSLRVFVDRAWLVAKPVTRARDSRFGGFGVTVLAVAFAVVALLPLWGDVPWTVESRWRLS